MILTPVRGDRNRRKAPGRGYQRAVDRWVAALVSQLEAIPPTDNPATLQAAVERIRLPAFRAATLVSIGRPLSRHAIAAEHRELVAAGMPRDFLVDASRADDRVVDRLYDLVAGSLLGEWAQEGVDLIQTLGQRELQKLPGLFSAVLLQGGRWESVVEEMRKAGARTRAHARLIARDQVARLNGQVTQRMQQRAGVEEYVWWAVLDERTRDTHRAAHGKSFRWDGPGAPGVGFRGDHAHPGQAGACRCRAKPVVNRQWARR